MLTWSRQASLIEWHSFYRLLYMYIYLYVCTDNVNGLLLGAYYTRSL